MHFDLIQGSILKYISLWLKRKYFEFWFLPSCAVNIMVPGGPEYALPGPARTQTAAGSSSPWGIPYLLSIPVGLEGVLQSMVTSFLRHRSISTVLKKATD